MRSILHLSLLFTFASLGLAADAGRDNQEDDIRETVFRYQFDHNASSLQKSAKVYCLSYGENNDGPSDKFMKRFAHHKPPVRKALACVSSVNGVIDLQTGKKGLLFLATSILWFSESEVEVSGGYYENGIGASGNTYTVKKEKGKWKVTHDEMNWISQAITPQWSGVGPLQPAEADALRSIASISLSRDWSSCESGCRYTCDLHLS